VIDRYLKPRLRAQNAGYVSASVAVPINELFTTLVGAMSMSWTVH